MFMISSTGNFKKDEPPNFGDFWFTNFKSYINSSLINTFTTNRQ